MNNSITLLYVDDEPINLELFKINFRKKYTVLTALSGFEGLEVLKLTSNIIIVISDMKMPGMNGVEFIKKAKQEFPSVLFYILTGFDVTEEISVAMEEKLIHKYFRKPFNVVDIEKAINEVLN